MVNEKLVPSFRAAFDDDRFIIDMITFAKGNPGGNGDSQFVRNNPVYRQELEAAAAAENRTIDDPKFKRHMVSSISRWKMEAINSRPTLAKYRKAPRRRRQNAGGAAALGQPNSNGNNNAVSASAAAAPSHVVPSNGHVQPVQPQQPMGVAMAYAQQQALQAAQQQQQRHQPGNQMGEYVGSAVADGPAPDNANSSGDYPNDGNEEDGKQGGGGMIVSAGGAGKRAASGADGGVYDITAGVGGVTIGGGRNMHPAMFGALSSAPSGGVNHTVMPQGFFQWGQEWGAMQQKARAADRMEQQRDQEMQLKAQENNNTAAAYRVIEAAQKAQAEAEKRAADEKERRVAAEQEKEDAMKKAAEAQKEKKEAGAQQNQLDKIEKGLQEGFTEIRNGLKGMNETLNTPIPARVGLRHDRDWYDQLENIAGNNARSSPLRQPSFERHGHNDGDGYSSAYDNVDFDIGSIDGKQPTAGDISLDGDLTMGNLFSGVDECEPKIVPSNQGPGVEKEDPEEKKDDDSGIEETTKIASLGPGIGKDFSNMVREREEKQRAELEREEEEERVREEAARERKIETAINADASIGFRASVIPNAMAEPTNERLLSISEYEENQVREELMAREEEEEAEEAKSKSKQKPKPKKGKGKGKGEKTELGPKPEPPFVEIQKRFDEDNKRKKTRWFRCGKQFAGEILEVTSVKNAAHCTRKLRSNKSSTGWVFFCKYDGGGNDRVVLYDPAHFELVNVAVEDEE